MGIEVSGSATKFGGNGYLYYLFNLVADAFYKYHDLLAQTGGAGRRHSIRAGGICILSSLSWDQPAGR